MKNVIKQVKGNAILTALLSAVYGLVLIIWPDTSAKTLCYVVAATIILVGLMYIIQYIRKDVMQDFYRRELVYGVLALILGTIALFRVEIIQSVIPVILGVIVLYSGIVKLQNAFDLMRLHYQHWGWVMAFAVLNIVFALILLLKPIWIVDVLFVMIGIGLLYSGVSDLITIFLFSSSAKGIEKK